MKSVARIILILTVLTVGTLSIAYEPDLPVNELTGIYTSEHSKFVNIAGTNVHYRVEGDGPAVILIHGTSSSLHTWDAWTDALKHHYTVVRLDLPAFGLTGPRPDKDYSIGAYVSVVRELMDSLGIQSAAVAGNSLGGDIAWRLAVTHPDRVNKLILVDAAGYPREPGDLPAIFMTTPVAMAIMPHLAPRFMYGQNVKDAYHDHSRIDDALVDRYRNLMLREGNRQAMVDRINEPFVDEHSRIASITQPTLIQWGKHDRWIPPGHAERFKNDIPHSKLIWYEAGHVPMEELPSETVKDALDFLSEKKP